VRQYPGSSAVLGVTVAGVYRLQAVEAEGGTGQRAPLFSANTEATCGEDSDARRACAHRPKPSARRAR